MSVLSVLQKIANNLELIQQVVHKTDGELGGAELERKEFEKELCRNAFKGTEFEGLHKDEDHGEGPDNDPERHRLLHSHVMRMSNLKYCGKLQVLTRLLNLWQRSAKTFE